MCAGTGEVSQKGGTPKGRIPCGFGSWAYGEQPYDCHLCQMKRYPDRDGSVAISYVCILERRALERLFLMYIN